MPDLTRRRFIAGGASLGALTLLTGCDVSDSSSAEALLTKISKFNDAVQAAIFNPNTLAPTYPEKRRSRSRFPSTPITASMMRRISTAKTWKLEVRGLVENKKTVDARRAL